MLVPLKSRFIQLNEEEFFLFAQEMQGFQVERTADGTILIRELAGSETGNFNSEVTTEVSLWNRKKKQGKTFDSSTGFTLPNEAVRSPDTAWIALERWEALPKADRLRFAHISPDFVIEIRSQTDSLSVLQAKMTEYINNGVRLAWLIDPQEEQVFLYRADGSVEAIDSSLTPLSGEAVLPGFELRLSELLG